MTRSDYIGLGTSIVLHGLLALLFGALTASNPQPREFGYVEVEFGDFSPGQPVQAVDEASQSTTPEPEQSPEQPTPEPQQEPQQEAQEEPVDLPEQEQTETVPPTEEEATPPEPQPEPEPEQGADEERASQAEGATEGDSGTGTTEQKTAPYNIEGLDRDPVFAPLPAYQEQVNARIRVRITVDPQGRIVRRFPLMKGNPQLEEAVMSALQRWQFNPLPEGAPQENQTGVITFTFRLE